jgi:hypothetical protein
LTAAVVTNQIDVAGISLTPGLSAAVRQDMNPRLVGDKQSLRPMGFGEDLDDAVRQALRDMIRWIGELLRGLSKADACTLWSLAADFRVTQIVNMAKGAHLHASEVQAFHRGSNGVTLGDLLLQDRPNLQRGKGPHPKVLASYLRRTEEPALFPCDRGYLGKNRGVYGGQIGS